MAIYEVADTLKDMPLLGRTGRKTGTRELTISGFPFMIIYRAGKDAVEVVRVLPWFPTVAVTTNHLECDARGNKLNRGCSIKGNHVIHSGLAKAQIFARKLS